MGKRKRGSGRLVFSRKRFFSRLTAVVFCVLAFSPLAAADTYNERPGSGLFVASNPGEARVFIDGVEQGRTPLDIRALENGDYSIRVAKDGYIERHFRIVVQPRIRIEVTIDLEEAKGKITAVITRDPRAPQSLDFNPLLFIDGSLAREMPVVLAAGWHYFSVDAPGWEPLRQLVYLAGGETKTVELVLRPPGLSAVPEQPAAEEPAAPPGPAGKFYPLTVSSSAGGLFFSPSPESIPRNSFQIEAGFLAGKPLLGEGWGTGLPLAAGGRFSFLERLEIAAAFNAHFRFEDTALWGFGASAKWTFFQPGDGPAGLGAAALLSYGAAEAGPYTAFGMGTGLLMAVPLALRIMPDTPLDFLLNPYLLWAGPAGYPENALPRTGLSGGVLYRYNDRFSGGFSMRWDYAASAAVPQSDSALSGTGPVMSALEFKFTPGNFVFFLTGGIWNWKTEGGGFIGAGIAFIR
jgi:hypothetical protein